MGRKIIVSNLMSLDGYFEGANKSLDWFMVSDEFFEYAKQLLRKVDTILFGKATYEHMAMYWPSAPSDEIADKMNGLRKLVFSNSLEKVTWRNSFLVPGEASEEVKKLKSQPGGDMVIFGSAKLASSLLNDGMIDEYRVIVNPVLLGSGTPMFENIGHRIKLKLRNSRSFASGVVVLYYEPSDRQS